MKPIRAYMGWPYISGGVQHEFREDWHGLACTWHPREAFSMAFMRVCMDFAGVQHHAHEGFAWVSMRFKRGSAWKSVDLG